MTMPHLMNCDHSEDGWCLDCVKKLHDGLYDGSPRGPYSGDLMRHKARMDMATAYLSNLSRAEREQVKDALAPGYDKLLALADSLRDRINVLENALEAIRCFVAEMPADDGGAVARIQAEVEKRQQF